MLTTSSTEAREDQTSSGTASPSAAYVTTGFTRKVGRRGVLGSMPSLVARLSHPFGRHDFVEELEFTIEDGIIQNLGLERYCWICRRPA